MLYRNGSGKNAALRSADNPAPTIMFGARSNKVDWVSEGGDEVSNEVWATRPATTVTASSVVAGPGRSEFVKGGVSRQDRPGSVRVTVEEAAILQTYPHDFIWNAPITDAKGRTKLVPKTKQFLQIGNAVPCLLAEVVLEALWAGAPVVEESQAEQFGLAA